MRVLKWLLGGVLGLVAVLAVGGWLMGSDFHVTRSVLVKAAPEKIYPLVADPRNWKQWSVWNQRDPAMAITYSGPPSGVGAVWEWRSATEGDGRMTFTRAESPGLLGYELYFPDFGTTSRGELRLVPEGGDTRVTWTMDGNMGRNPFFSWFALFADGMVGKDFEGGLAGLKAVAEK
jgi:uncharacterized protein YndB with AHSA1/START domain